MLEPVSVGLKLAFLAVLYLFLLWVARSALRDLRRSSGPRVSAAGPVTAPAADATGFYAAPGMDGDVEIHLEDPFASTRHARLVRQGAIVVIEDLGSTNGTYLNEELLTGPQPLHRGDRVRIGDSEFTYVDQ